MWVATYRFGVMDIWNLATCAIPLAPPRPENANLHIRCGAVAPAFTCGPVVFGCLSEGVSRQRLWTTYFVAKKSQLYRSKLTAAAKVEVDVWLRICPSMRRERILRAHRRVSTANRRRSELYRQHCARRCWWSDADMMSMKTMDDGIELMWIIWSSLISNISITSREVGKAKFA